MFQLITIYWNYYFCKFEENNKYFQFKTIRKMQLFFKSTLKLVNHIFTVTYLLIAMDNFLKEKIQFLYTL